VEVINLGQSVWSFETGTIRELIQLGQSVCCVETATIGEVTHLLKAFGLLKLGQLGK
jgi:hypothetical protein